MLIEAKATDHVRIEVSGVSALTLPCAEILELWERHKRGTVVRDDDPEPSEAMTPLHWFSGLALAGLLAHLGPRGRNNPYLSSAVAADAVEAAEALDVALTGRVPCGELRAAAEKLLAYCDTCDPHAADLGHLPDYLEALRAALKGQS